MSYRKDYISWDECFMRMAHVIADRSKDPSTQAGAVIASQNNVVVGLGYNGWPRGIETEALPWERKGDLADTKYAYVVHAEENAIYNANAKTKGCKLYCTLFPCNDAPRLLSRTALPKLFTRVINIMTSRPG